MVRSIKPYVSNGLIQENAIYPKWICLYKKQRETHEAYFYNSALSYLKNDFSNKNKCKSGENLKSPEVAIGLFTDCGFALLGQILL